MAIHYVIKGDTLVITVDVSQAAREAAATSKSGKTLLLASTGGFVRFGDIGVSLHVTIPNKARSYAPGFVRFGDIDLSLNATIPNKAAPDSPGLNPSPRRTSFRWLNLLPRRTPWGRLGE